MVFEFFKECPPLKGECEPDTCRVSRGMTLKVMHGQKLNLYAYAENIIPHWPLPVPD